MPVIRKGEKEVKDLEDWAAVHKVYKQTQSKRATASILGISRNTVKKLLSMKEEPVYHRTEYHSKIDCYKELIIEWRCEPYCFNGTRIFRELKARGYDGSIGPIYRFLRKVDEDVDGRISSKATTRQQHGMKVLPVIRHSSTGQNTRLWSEADTGQFTASHSFLRHPEKKRFVFLLSRMQARFMKPYRNFLRNLAV
jgi:transposase